MVSYQEVGQLARNMSQNSDWSAVTSRLVGLWLGDYTSVARSPEIVETRYQNFSYLFDMSTILKMLCAG